MKKLFPILALSLFFSLKAYAQDVAVYGLAQTAVTDESQGIIASYSAMESTFAVALASNVYHEAALFEGLETQVTPVYYSYQRFFGEIGFSVSGAGFFTDYYYGAKYFLEMIDFGFCGTGNFWIDYWGFGFLPADHPSPYGWPSTGTICQTVSLIYLGGIPVIASLDNQSQRDLPKRIGECTTGTFTNCVVGPNRTDRISFQFDNCVTGMTQRVAYTKVGKGDVTYEYRCLRGGYELIKKIPGVPSQSFEYFCGGC